MKLLLNVLPQSGTFKNVGMHISCSICDNQNCSSQEIKAQYFKELVKLYL